MSLNQEKRFDNQVAIVTGAGGGMGREHAKLLALRGGASVVVNDLSNGAEETVQMIKDASGEAVVNHNDVSNEAGASDIIEAAINNFGRLDILVSNAGIYREVPFSKMTEQDFDKVMKVNAYGTFFVTKAAWPHFVKQNYGRIVLVSSSLAFASQPLGSQYAASKGAVLGLGRTLAAEGVEYGIQVNLLTPGAFSPMAADSPNALEDEEARKQVEKMMHASLVTPIVAWLSHKDNKLNGEIIEAASGRAALNFVGSTKGYWDKELTIEGLFKNQDKVFAKDGFKSSKSVPELSKWMIENTGWGKN